MHIRPCKDWLVVKLHPLPETTVSGLILPKGTSGVERQREGTVLRVGPGLRDRHGVRTPVGIIPGERVAFFREHLEHRQGKQMVGILQELEKDVGMIRKDDVLFIIEES